MISFWESLRWSFCSSAMVRSCAATTISRSAQIERFAQVNPPDLRICRETLGTSLSEDLPFFDDIGAIGDLQCFSHVMIGDQDPDPARAQLRNDALNLEDGDG